MILMNGELNFICQDLTCNCIMRKNALLLYLVEDCSEAKGKVVPVFR